MPWLLLVALLPVAYGVASLFSYLKGSAKQAFSPLDSVYYCALFGGAFFMVYAYGRDDSFWHLAFLVKAGLWWFALAMLYAMGAGLKDKKGGIAPAIERILRGSRVSHAAENAAARKAGGVSIGRRCWPLKSRACPTWPASSSCRVTTLCGSIWPTQRCRKSTPLLLNEC